MWIRLSRNAHDIGCDMEGMPDEFKSLVETKEKVQEFLVGAYEMATKVWDEHPEFKMVTFDTFSKEELEMLEQAKNTNAKNKGS